eukprot:1474989-Prymnesium_polylepis.1
MRPALADLLAERDINSGRSQRASAAAAAAAGLCPRVRPLLTGPAPPCAWTRRAETQLVERGAMATLVMHLESPNEELQTRVCGLIYGCCEQVPSVRRELYRLSAVKKVLPLLASSAEEVQEAAARAIEKMSRLPVSRAPRAARARLQLPANGLRAGRVCADGACRQRLRGRGACVCPRAAPPRARPSHHPSSGLGAPLDSA